MRLEAAQVDRELEASRQETLRLQQMLARREAEVAQMRERVAAQRAQRSREAKK